ncbi:hypothetical protein B0H14DRAFT_3744200 [Mycena olivaceomarginata]|nr:hypothetical protein B0H14DRAFT_3744200 [Mycena olivaceomarginata]
MQTIPEVCSSSKCLNEGVPAGENAERVTNMGERRERDKFRTAGGAQERWTGRSLSTWPWQAACRLSVKPDPDPRLTEAQHDSSTAVRPPIRCTTDGSTYGSAMRIAARQTRRQTSAMQMHSRLHPTQQWAIDAPPSAVMHTTRGSPQRPDPRGTSAHPWRTAQAQNSSASRSPRPKISRRTHHARDARRSRRITLLSTSRSTIEGELSSSLRFTALEGDRREKARLRKQRQRDRAYALIKKHLQNCVGRLKIDKAAEQQDEQKHAKKKQGGQFLCTRFQENHQFKRTSFHQRIRR